MPPRRPEALELIAAGLPQKREAAELPEEGLVERLAPEEAAEVAARQNPSIRQPC